jgi:hypothetical protein
MLRHLRVRALLVTAIAGILATSASSSYAHTGQLRFITVGLRCSAGVCALPAAAVGQNYGQDLAITGGSCGRPCSALPVFTVTTGRLPGGLTMPPTYGCCGDVIAGTPTGAGKFTFTVQARDGAGDVAQQAFLIAVAPAGPPQITFPATCCPAGRVGASYLQNFFLTGGVPPFTSAISSGSLPPGLHLAASPPISITGVPTASGTFAFTVAVTDSTGATATKPGSITVP